MLGNTCYLNATVQSLFTVPELRECLKRYALAVRSSKSGVFHCHLSVISHSYNGSLSLDESYDRAHDIIVSLRDTYIRMDNSSTVMPILLLKMLHMMFPQFAEKAENGQLAQQDANECWSELVKVLQQKLTVQSGDTSKMFITQYFGGVFNSTLKCIESEEEEVTTTSENFLQLSCFISQGIVII